MKFWDETANFQLRLDSQHVPLVKETKFLGVYIDNKLSWHYHINYIIDKLNNNRRLLQLGRNLLNRTCKHNVYYSHLHSHMVYGVTVWGSMANESQLNSIHKIQDQCIQIIRNTKETTTPTCTESLKSNLLIK